MNDDTTAPAARRIGRRAFLKRVAGAAAGVAASGALSPRLFAQSRPPAPGVGIDTIRVAMVADFSGGLANVGTELYRGTRALLNEVNSSGGVHGRQIVLDLYDDGYVADRTLEHMLGIVNRGDSFALMNFVGTPTNLRVAPVMLTAGISMVGPRTGTPALRTPPYAERYHVLRASYTQEASELAAAFWSQGYRAIGVHYAMNSFGRSGPDGVDSALAARGARLTAESTHRPRSGIEADLSTAFEHLVASGCDSVICCASNKEYAAFVMAARDAGWRGPIANVSPGLSALGVLTEQEALRGVPSGTYTAGLINSRVVPVTDSALPGVTLFRQVMDRQNPPAPELLATDYLPVSYSGESLEGFLNAQLLVEGLRRAGPDLTRAGFDAAVASIVDYDLGLGAPASFAPGAYEGLSVVYPAVVRDGRWSEITDWSAALAS